MSKILPSLMADLHWSLAFLKQAMVFFCHFLSCHTLSAYNNVLASVLTVDTSGPWFAVPLVPTLMLMLRL